VPWFIVNIFFVYVDLWESSKNEECFLERSLLTMMMLMVCKKKAAINL